TELGGKLSADALVQTFRAAPEKGLCRALLGDGAAAALRARGDQAGAAEVDSDTRAARRAAGLDQRAENAGPGDPGRLGLALSLSGKYQPIGEAALRAAMLATGAPATPAIQLSVRDMGNDLNRAARGLGELAVDESVIGIVAAMHFDEKGAPV